MSTDRPKLLQQIQGIKDRSYDKGLAFVLADIARLGFPKLTVRIMQNHHLDLDHFVEVPPADYRAIKEAWLKCGMPPKPGPRPEGRPKVSDPRYRQK